MNSNLPKYADLPLKKYYIVHFDFRVEKYFVYEYESKKTLTVRQMWQKLYNQEFESIYSDFAPHTQIYWDILEKYNLPQKRTHSLMTFKS